MIAELYKHPVIIEDVRNLNPEEYKGYDLIVGSPPCRDFSKFALSVGKRWKDPPNPERGLELVKSFLNIVEVAQPRYWLMENVPKLREYLELPPRGIVRLSKQRYRCFWGTYPAFLVPSKHDLPNMTLHAGEDHVERTNGKLAKWLNAYIPETVSRALGKAVMSQITNNEGSA